MKEEYFREVQLPPRWAVILILLALALPLVLQFTVDEHPEDSPYVLLVVFGAFALIAGLFGTMKTIVDNEAVRVIFGPFGLIKFTFNAADIVSLNPRKYSPLWEYGGWGIKGSWEQRALNMRGDEGVDMTVKARRKNGMEVSRRVLIGTARREELAAALERLRQPFAARATSA